MNNIRGFEKAKEASKKSDYQNATSRHLGAAVFYKGELLALGYNSEKTHPMQHQYNFLRYKEDSPPKVHAEIMALSKIRTLDIDFSKVDVYVYRETADGRVAMSRPCKSCEKCMKDMGIKKIHYTGPNSYIDEKYI